jgi:hypothetical protein
LVRQQGHKKNLSGIRGFPKTSVFVKAALDLWEKAGRKPLFPGACPKTVRFQRTAN